MILLSIQFANALRAIALAEIFFTIGWLVARIWKNRNHPWRYLSMMGVALITYSAFAGFIIVGRWNRPLSWEAPLVLIAATISVIAVIREGIHHKGGNEIDN